MAKIDEELIEQEENLPATAQEQSAEVQTYTVPTMNMGAVTPWNDIETFEKYQRMAKLLMSSEIAPQSYRGKLADCFIAIDMANRMGVSPIVVMQNSQIVRGNFSWKGSACKAMIDGCGRYKEPSKYIEVGERDKDSWGYYLQAIEKDGTVVKGVKVDIAMAKSEGWYQKDGSKWKTMPELMLKYRAAAFFLRTECPSLAMGFLTTEEQEDIAKPQVNPEDCVCADCGATIKENVYQFSSDKFGKPLCFNCQKKYK